MRIILLILFYFSSIVSIFGQDLYFDCDQLGIRITKGSIKISLEKKSKLEIENKIMSFIESNHYTFKPYYSNDHLITFRDFTIICDKKTCGSEIIAKNIFYIEYGDGFVNISMNNEIFSSIYGAKLIINDNDDVASQEDIPFGHFEFQVPEKYSNVFPESIYSFDKKGRTKVKNPFIQNLFLEFYNNYINNFKSFLEK